MKICAYAINWLSATLMICQLALIAIPCCYYPQITRAEVKVANALVHHNIPLAVADHLSPLFKDIFPDSDIAKERASTKTTCMINGSLAPHFKSAVSTS